MKALPKFLGVLSVFALIAAVFSALMLTGRVAETFTLALYEIGLIPAGRVDNATTILFTVVLLILAAILWRIWRWAATLPDVKTDSQRLDDLTKEVRNLVKGVDSLVTEIREERHGRHDSDSADYD